MSAGPKPPKKAPRAAPITKKSNLASKEHEALLQWLIVNRESICDILLGRGRDWFEKATAKAIQDFHRERDSLLNALERASDDESLPSVYRNACSAKLKLARSFFKKIGALSPPDYDSASCPVVKKWNAQARTFTPEDYRPGRMNIESKPVGFVDLQVLLAIPNTLEVTCFGEHSSDLGTKWHSEYADGTDSVANLQIFEPVWSCDSYDGVYYHRVWFDVWTELPSIGELLQHLKTLADLNRAYIDVSLSTSSAYVKTSVALVVPAINESLQEIIEHEGFHVMSKQWYEADD